MLDVLNTTGQSVDLSSRAMLAAFKVRSWSGRKLDKRVSADVAASNGAASDAGRYNKALVAKDSLKEITQAVAAARITHAKLSLPWMQDGARIMPADAFSKYTEAMQGLRERFESAVADFLAAYDAEKDEARQRLGAMFSEDDYPSRDQVAGKFSWSIDILPMPSASDFRVELGDEAQARIRAEIESNLAEVIDSAMGDAWSRLHGAVVAMSDKLKAYTPATDETKASGIFRDSLVDNVRELVEILPLLNVSGDAQLAKAIDAARDKLTKRDAKDLREDDIARVETQEAAEEIADAMAAFMGV